MTCKICGAVFEVCKSMAKAYATCSKQCGLEYRSRVHKGRKITWGEKISAARKGKPVDRSYITPEYREHQRQTAKANGSGGHYKGKKLSAEHREKMSRAHKGHSRGGWKLSVEARRNISEGHKGEKSYLWQGGKQTENRRIRKSFEYKEWRRQVFERDDYTCVFCGARGVRLNADHIKPFASHPELRFDLNNGRTLCEDCHRKTPTYLKRNRTRAEHAS